MNIRLVHDPERGDMVELAGRGHARFTFDAWLNTTEAAAKAIRSAMSTTWQAITPAQFHAACEAKDWLIACGVTTALDFYDLEKHLPLLKLPPNPSRSRLCKICGSQIWGREALLIGIGSECRRKASRRAALAGISSHVRHAAFERLIDRETAQAGMEA